ncbi:MAG: hypothetical protein AB7F79_01160 [Steroidobacteraceae bacterium]
MAIGWFTLLKSVPWSTVISNAPVIAEGAKKLWSAVASKSSASTPVSVIPLQVDAGNQTVATLHQRMVALEAAATKLETQMLASTEIIKEMAEQNTQLIELIKVNRIRTRWLARATGVLIIVVIWGVVNYFSS